MQLYRNKTGGAPRGVTGLESGGGYSIGTPSAPPSETGKYNIDVTNPAGSSIPGADILGGIGDIGVGPLTAKNIIGTVGDIAGGAGDIGIPGTGIGVKQTLGVAGEALAGPGRYVQMQYAKGRVETMQQAAKIRAAGGYVPEMVGTLPEDIQLALDSGASVEDAANMLVDRNAGFTSDPLVNMAGAIVLDPVNLASFGAGKAISLGAKAGASLNLARDAAEIGGTAAAINTRTRVMGTMYNAVTNGLSRAGAAQAERMLGPVTAGVERAHPDAHGMIERLSAINSSAGAQLSDALGRSNAQLAGALWGKQLALRFKAKLGLVMDAAERAGFAKEWIGRQIRYSKKAFEDDAYGLALATRVTPVTADPAILADEAVTMLARTSGASEDVVRQALFPTGRATVREWQAARQMQYGAAVKEALSLPVIDDAAMATGTRRPTLVAHDTLDHDTQQAYLDQFASFESSTAVAARREHKLAKLADSQAREYARLTARRNDVASRLAAADDPTLRAELARLDDRLAHIPRGTLPPPTDVLERPLPRTPAEVNPIDDVLGPATKEDLAAVAVGEASRPQLARKILHDHPEIAHDLRAEARAVAGPGRQELTASWQDVERWLKVHLPEAPTLVKRPITGEHPLPPGYTAFLDKWEGQGYRLGFEPDLGHVVADLGEGVYEPIRPFVPMLDDSLVTTRRNALGRVYDTFFAGITQTRIITEAQDRMVESLAKRHISADESHTILRSILNAAGDSRLTPRAMYDLFEYRSAEKPGIFASVLGVDRYRKMRNQGFNPIWEVNHAFQGNIGTVGLTQYATGAVKTWGTTWLRNYPVKIAEGLYPKLKFNWNPLFGTQEVIESPFFNTLRGINPWSTGDISKEFDAVYTAMQRNQIARSVYEAGYGTFAAGQLAATEAFGPASTWGQRFDRLFPEMRLGGLSGYKERQATLQAFRAMPNEFRDAVQSVAPDAWRVMELEYNTTDAAVITQRFIESRLNMVSGQRGLDYEIKAVKAANLAPDARTETVMQAYEWALRRSSDQAYKTQFFNPSRGWLERTLNHPYLGFYPLSYMWGKVVPEFSRFLFLHPFGLDAPMLGYDAAQHVREMMIVQMSDPEFAKQMEDNKGAIYLIQLLLPATPENIPVNAPAWSRHLADAAGKGKILGKGGYNVPYEASSGIQHIGVLNLPNTLNQALSGPLGGVLGGLTDSLQEAADIYDGNR